MVFLQLIFQQDTHFAEKCKVQVTQKDEWSPRRFKGPFLTDMGHFFLLPFTAAFLKFSPYNRALYTIKPSLTPPPQPLLVSDLQTQVICHQRGVLGETASPTLDFHSGAVRSWCSCAEFLNIVRNESGTETWMEKWCQSVYTCASVYLTPCVSVFGIYSLTVFYLWTKRLNWRGLQIESALHTVN